MHRALASETRGQDQTDEATFGSLYVTIPPTPGGFVETETITSGAANWAEGNLQSNVYADGK